MRNTSARNTTRTKPAAERPAYIPVKFPPAEADKLRLLARLETNGNVSKLVRRFVAEGMERALGRAA